MSIPFRERNPVPIGAIGLLSIALVLFLAFNIQSIPLIGGGDHYSAAFSEAGGLIKGDDVRIAGVKVGKVTKVDLAGNRVMVDFKVTEPAAFGTADRCQRADEDAARAKYLALEPPVAASSRRAPRSRWSGPSRPTTSSTPSPTWPPRPSGSTPASSPSRSPRSRRSSRTARRTSRQPWTA